MISNQAIADMFAHIADALEVLGENRFKVQAYRRASQTVAELTVGLDTLRQQGPLTDLPHVGESSAQIIEEMLDHGTSPLYDALMIRVPPGLVDMLRVPAIGPKTAARLYHEHEIADLHGLYAAAREGRLRKVKGFGAKTEARIVEAIDAMLSATPRIRLVDALRVMDELVAAMVNLEGVKQAAAAGSVRRGNATAGNLNLVVAAADREAVAHTIMHLPQVAHAARHALELQLTLHNAMQVQVQLVTPAQWGAALVWWTGSQAHVAQLQQLADQHGMLLLKDGLQGDYEAHSEQELYRLLGLDFIPPELREGWGEIEAAREGRLPQLVTASDLRADLHWHTTWSDGRSSLEAMVAAGRALGYTHMAVADHSAYLGVTGGLDGKRLRQQRAEIDTLNQQFAREGSDFQLLQCCEVDILPDGSLALADDILAQLDVVVASPHVALRQERAAATARLIKAIHNPHVDIIGHPTGRLLEARAGADIDLEAVIAAAADTGTALEVNAGPERLDLDGAHVYAALRAGVRISINTDAHAAQHLAHTGLGVLTARRGWATPADVINTWSYAAFQEWINTKG